MSVPIVCTDYKWCVFHRSQRVSTTCSAFRS